MKRWSLWAIGSGIYATALLVLAPATLFDAGLRAASNGRLALAQAEGTVWAGAGRIEFRDTGSANAIARAITWRVLPESLWRGRLVCEVALEKAPRRSRIAASWSKVEIADGEVNLPASALAFAEPRLKPLRLSGELQVHAERLTIGRDGMHGGVTLQWQEAGSAFSPVTPIGSYELKLDGRGGNVSALLGTLQGPLQLDGTGTWTMGRKPEFQATAIVPPQYREQFTPLLRLISLQRDEGTFELQLK